MNARLQHPVEREKGDLVKDLLLIRDDENKNVIDVGSGPLSLLLRTQTNRSGSVALDPLDFGDLEEAYDRAGVLRLIKCGEDLCNEDGYWDEAWVYNCLQHVKDPQAILYNVIAVSDLVRVFEWTNIDPYQGHLHKLTQEMLEAPFFVSGLQPLMRQNGWLNYCGMNGQYYAGIWSRA